MVRPTTLTFPNPPLLAEDSGSDYDFKEAFNGGTFAALQGLPENNENAVDVESEDDAPMTSTKKKKATKAKPAAQKTKKTVGSVAAKKSPVQASTRKYSQIEKKFFCFFFKKGFSRQFHSLNKKPQTTQTRQSQIRRRRSHGRIVIAVIKK